MDQINIIPIGSGSTGNCIYLELGPYRLLIDMGIGYKKVRNALEKHGRHIEDIDAIFVTHGHYDHVKASSPISHHTSCGIYTDRSSMYPLRLIDEERRIAQQIDTLTEPLPSLFVRMFPVPHDYVRTCGFSFFYGNRKVSIATDCGQMSERIMEELIGSDVIIIECNHDVEMLKHGPYPYPLQKRILSKYGHLSNDDCADTVLKLYEKGTRHFLLAHVSLNNNTPEIALQTVSDRTKDCDIDLFVCPFESDELLSYMIE